MGLASPSWKPNGGVWVMETAVRRRPGLQHGRPLTLALAGLVTLVACSGNPAPAPLADAATPTRTSTPSPSGPSSPTVAGQPTMPAVARGKSIRAAKAFVRYFITAVDYAMASGDTGLLDELGTADCSSCHAVAGNIEGVYSEGGALKGKGWRIIALSPVQKQPASSPIIQAAIFVNPQSKVTAGKATTMYRAGGRMAMVFFLRRGHDGWKVSRWDRAS